MDKNILLAKYFHKMLYHKNTTYQTKINELKTITCYKYELMRPSKGSDNLANLKICLFWSLFEEIEFAIDAKGSMQVSSCMEVMFSYTLGFLFSLK